MKRHWLLILATLFLTQSSLHAENDFIFSDSLESTRIIETFVDTVIQNGESVSAGGVLVTGTDEVPSSVQISNAINRFMEPITRIVVSGGNVNIDLSELLNPPSNALMAATSAESCPTIMLNYPVAHCIKSWERNFVSVIYRVGKNDIEDVRIPNDSTKLIESYSDGSERIYEAQNRDASRLYRSVCSVHSTCQGEPVLLIHGFQPENFHKGADIEDNGGAKYWGSFAQRLINDGHNPYEFIWLTNARFEDVAVDLFEAVSKIKEDTGKNVHIVAHSFGGVLTRRLLQDTSLNHVTSSVASVTTIGSPHLGLFGIQTDFNGTDFPAGKDNLITEWCNQISCYLMGEDTIGTVTATLLEAGSTPGAEAHFLASHKDFLPALNIQSLIGFQREHVWGIGDYATRGDGLISGWGQRFHPDMVFTEESIPKWDAPLYKSSMGDALVTEYFLGRHSSEETDPFLEPYERPYPEGFVAFKHSVGTIKITELGFDEIEPVVPLTGFHDVYQRVLDWIALNSPALVEITSFTASPPTIVEGGDTTITWTTQNAASCTPTGGAGGWDTSQIQLPSGSISISIATVGIHTFTLTCSNGLSDTVIKTIIVTVDQSAAVLVLEGHTGAVNAVAFSPDGSQLVSVSDDKTVRFWNPHNGVQIGENIAQSSEVTSVTYFPGHDFVITGARNGELNYWKFDGSSLGLATFQRAVYSVSVSSDAQRMMVGTGTTLLYIPPRPEVYVYDAQAGGAPLLVFGSEPSDAFYYSVVRSPAEDLILTAVAGVLTGSAKIWNGTTGSLVRRLDLGRVVNSVFSHDGKYALTTLGRKAKLWNIETAKAEENPAPLREFDGHSLDVNSVAFSPDDTMVITGSNDDTAKLWRTENAEIIQTFVGDGGDVKSVAFSPSGSLIALGSAYGTIKVIRISN